MKNLRNSVRLIGNLGNNPEIKETSNHKKLAKLSLATSEIYKNEDGEKVSETHWHNLVAWGSQAKIAEKYFKKGDEVAIEGKLTHRNYTDKDGVKRYISEILVNEMMKLNHNGKQEEE
jgi:single-strand DNA-binding protein